MSLGDLSGDGFASTTRFGALGLLDDGMDLGFVEEAGPHDLLMIDYGAQSLKRVCNLLKMLKSSSCGISPTKAASTLANSATSQVSLVAPCMVGDLGSWGSKGATTTLLAKEPPVFMLVRPNPILASLTYVKLGLKSTTGLPTLV